jgi:hypothetical protein
VVLGREPFATAEEELNVRYDSQTIDIAADSTAVHAFVADGANLARWAIGFAKSVEASPDGWLVTTGSGGKISTTIRSDATTGTIDFVMSPAPGVTAIAWSRVVPIAAGARFSFTQVQADGMPDDVFDAQVKTLTHELVALKALLEVDCPL